MQLALKHFMLLIFAIPISWLGWLISRNPERTSRIFTFGQAPTKFTVGYFRIVGRVFAIVFALGSIIYLILIPLDLLGVNFGQ